jgi:hypothetical protein
MRKASSPVRVATRSDLVEIEIAGIDVDTARVFAAEFKGAGFGDVPPGKMLVAIDLSVAVSGREECFGACGEPVDVTCALIAAASNAKVEGCLGSERLAEICGGGVGCPYDGVIVVNGVPSGTFGPFDPCEDNELTVNITFS